ncbi:DUF7410 domain-containing protein [Haloplanus halophilus]|uniref:DUF7410 domain-containing protein n=1 Tax=Haloplanus halophilus TaxID=2949993 RepID=UPI00203C6465|nr:hypothetical protein [Haloplanus sp. GDY1]
MFPDADRRDAHAAPETAVRDDETVAAVCPYCRRPFAEREAHDLHLGERHADACSAAERDAYDAAREAERDALFYYHLRVVAALGVLYAVTVLLYMVALGGGFL